ncbi:MAG: hypothetical protein ACRCSN_13315, partial [Dermatophilaceae bacterium]
MERRSTSPPTASASLAERPVTAADRSGTTSLSAPLGAGSEPPRSAGFDAATRDDEEFTGSFRHC